MRLNPARLNELIKGKRGITADAALDLAHVLGTSPEVWMNLQSHFDLAEAERKRKKRVNFVSIVAKTTSN